MTQQNMCQDFLSNFIIMIITILLILGEELFVGLAKMKDKERPDNRSKSKPNKNNQLHIVKRMMLFALEKAIGPDA
jgi:hypothetical protein